jgi:hypothetical protein
MSTGTLLWLPANAARKKSAPRRFGIAPFENQKLQLKSENGRREYELEIGNLVLVLLCGLGAAPNGPAAEAGPDQTRKRDKKSRAQLSIPPEK